MGIEHVWLLDLEERTAYTYLPSELKLVKSADLKMTVSPICMNLAELFAALD